MRLKAAERAGLTYDEYVAELLDTGRRLQPGDARVAEILRARQAT